jgi:aspartyl-tRNA(Asn)/glutamyl-tRNA(Gln) amidotransferase subunit C
MAALMRKEVEEIALLARLHLGEDELARMETELGAILAHFSSIAAVETEGVAPMTHAVPIECPLRSDDVVTWLDAEAGLAGAPKREGELIVVPAVIGGAE